MLRGRFRLEEERKGQDTRISDKRNSKELCEEEDTVDCTLQPSYKRKAGRDISLTFEDELYIN